MNSQERPSGKSGASKRKSWMSKWLGDSSTDSATQLVEAGWIADYPPWFHEFWIKPAKCKTKERASHLLHFLRAIEDGQAEDAKRLLPGIDPNLRLAVEDSKTESLLEWAVEKSRNPDCVRLIVAAGADPKASNLVYKLVTYGARELLPELLKAGADPNAGEGESNALIAACWNDPDTVRLLLDAGAHMDATTTVYITNKKHVGKVTPLMVAAYAGQVEVVKTLLHAEVDVSAIDSAGNTAVAWAKVCRTKAKGAKIVTLLEQAGALSEHVGEQLPMPVDFSKRAKSPEFKEALALAKRLTKSESQTIELAEGPLRGAHAFRIRDPQSALSLLDEVRPKAASLHALAFLSENLFEPSTPYLVLMPTLDYREAVVAFETPEGQSMDCYELNAWLTELEKTEPFVLTHLAPDLFRARFAKPIQNPSNLAKAIQRICPDVINESISKVARHLEQSQELYLWWD